MTPTEFNTWLDYHKAAFPALGKWLKDHPETVKFWIKPFGGVSVDAAKAATDAMAAGELDEPRGFGSHPKVIAKHARELQHSEERQQFTADGEPIYNCPRCLDQGFVAVVDPVHYRAGELRACHVLCTCREGDRKAGRKYGDGHQPIFIPRFDAVKMFPWDYEIKLDEFRRDFETWLATGRGVTSHSNYTDFGDYSHERQEAF